MSQPLMPKATAVWLIENTSLTFEQIGHFCHLHILEIQVLADGEAGTVIAGMDPVSGGQLTHEEIARCEADSTQHLVLSPAVTAESILGTKKTRYMPLSKRQDRPDAIAWILKNHPQISELQLSRLLGTTKATIRAIKTRTHKNMQNIKARNPVLLGLCTQADINEALALSKHTGVSEKSEE